jgi:hypothetical protein
MGDSTSILDLPTDPLGGANLSNNINISATEMNSNIINPNMMNQNINQNGNRENNSGSFSLDQTTINQIVNGLQQASVAGATQLPSRDIPMNTHNITQDPNIQPNYIPPVTKNDEIINSYNKNINRSNSIDDMYNEIQTPLLLALLYFLLQLPFFKKQLYTYFPILFNLDGNYNIYGYLFSSILFGMLFYLLTRVSESFGKF